MLLVQPPRSRELGAWLGALLLHVVALVLVQNDIASREATPSAPSLLVPTWSNEVDVEVREGTALAPGAPADDSEGRQADLSGPARAKQETRLLDSEATDEPSAQGTRRSLARAPMPSKTGTLRRGVDASARKRARSPSSRVVTPALIHSGVWGTGPGDVWVVGQSNASGAGSFSHWDGSTWTHAIRGEVSPVWDVWGSSADDVWAVAEHGTVLRRDGSDWSVIGRDIGTSGPIPGIWGSGPNDIWATGTAFIHWNGREWSAVGQAVGPAPLLDIWGSGASDVWAVGIGGRSVHWNGSDWSVSNSGTTADLLGVWGSAKNDVWAVGFKGAIRHWNGSRWAAVESGTTADLADVWGSGAGDVWVVGLAGSILRWDGVKWAAYPSGTAQTLQAVWGSGANDVWAVGSASTIVHWNGVTWTAAPQ